MEWNDVQKFSCDGILDLQLDMKWLLKQEDKYLLVFIKNDQNVLK